MGQSLVTSRTVPGRKPRFQRLCWLGDGVRRATQGSGCALNHRECCQGGVLVVCLTLVGQSKWGGRRGRFPARPRPSLGGPRSIGEHRPAFRVLATLRDAGHWLNFKAAFKVVHSVGWDRRRIIDDVGPSLVTSRTVLGRKPRFQRFCWLGDGARRATQDSGFCRKPPRELPGRGAGCVFDTCWAKQVED